jgi:LysR family transcriptional regulator, hypochlorite-specific transcription factor HypT
MDIGWIEDFLALARIRNFSRAATERNITQPAFSRRIRAIEDWIGSELIDRSMRGFALTPAGQRFLDGVPQVMTGIEALRRDCACVGGTAVNLVATHALASTFVNEWLSGLDPTLALKDYSLEAADISACVAAVASGRCDFMIVPAVIESSELAPNDMRKVTVGSDALALVGSPEIASDVRRMGVAEGLRGRLALYGMASPFHVLLISRLAQYNLRDCDIISPLVAVLKSMALTGKCAAFLPVSGLAEEFASGRLLRLEPASADISYEISMYRRQCQLTPFAEHIWRRANMASQQHFDTRCEMDHLAQPDTQVGSRAI